LYDFAAEEGATVRDRSGVGDPLDLRIADTKAVRRDKGSLEIRGKTVFRSDRAASKLSDAIRRSGQLSLEAWLAPARIDQSGPARIVTLSKYSTERNFTLGQDGERFDVRLRTIKTSGNGLPSLGSPSGSLRNRLTHVVYTRSRSGHARLHLDGKQVAEESIAGDLSNWNGSFQLALGNELTGDREWLGTFHLVAVYNLNVDLKHVGA
jgi:hypothetical protein